MLTNALLDLKSYRIFPFAKRTTTGRSTKPLSPVSSGEHPHFTHPFASVSSNRHWLAMSSFLDQCRTKSMIPVLTPDNFQDKLRLLRNVSDFAPHTRTISLCCSRCVSDFRISSCCRPACCTRCSANVWSLFLASCTYIFLISVSKCVLQLELAACMN